jgi:hypothetical protein
MKCQFHTVLKKTFSQIHQLINCKYYVFHVFIGDNIAKLPALLNILYCLKDNKICIKFLLGITSLLYIKFCTCYQ